LAASEQLGTERTTVARPHSRRLKTRRTHLTNRHPKLEIEIFAGARRISLLK